MLNRWKHGLLPGCGSRKREKRDLFGAIREELPVGVHFWMAPNWCFGADQIFIQIRRR